MGKTLVIYYSRKGMNYVNGSIRDLKKGNTQIVAEYFRDVTGADLFEVDTVHAYSSDYITCTDEAKKELQRNERPPLKRYLDSIEAYDQIVVAGPCWWGTYPMAIFTQLDRLDFTGKKVFPVMTHEGSGLAGAPAALKKHCKGASFGQGLAIHGADAASSKKIVTDYAISNLT